MAMSSNSRWFPNTQHSLSFKAEHETVLFTQSINIAYSGNVH